MRRLLAGVAALFAWTTVPAFAQQGSLQVVAAAQAVTGDPHRIGGQNRLEPDLGVSWIQPRSRLGLFQLEVRGARRDNRLHPGRMFMALRDVKYRGMAWALEAGDTHFNPAIGEYKFSNIFTPAVTFNGASITGRTRRTSVSFVAGRTSAWRNIFGSDPETLGQTLGIATATHKTNERLELSVRASRVRTSNLREFSYSIAASDQAGGGARFWLTPAIQLAADGSIVSYRRVGTLTRESDASTWWAQAGCTAVDGFSSMHPDSRRGTSPR